MLVPDLAASIAPMKLMLVNIVDGTGNSDDPESIAEDISVITNAYRHRNASCNLIIESGNNLNAFFF